MSIVDYFACVVMVTVASIYLKFRLTISLFHLRLPLGFLRGVLRK